MARYSEGDVAYLREHAGKVPWATIAAELGRSARAVTILASRLGIEGSHHHPRSVAMEAEERTCSAPLCSNTFQARRTIHRYCSPQCSRVGVSIRSYGLTDETWMDLFESQERACVCGSTESGSQGWAVDHDHSCCPGKGSCGECVRGILCNPCNLALGHLKDDLQKIRALAEYLERDSADGRERAVRHAADPRRLP